MKRIANLFVTSLVALPVLVWAQGGDANALLAAARTAMGGDALAAITSLAATGRATRVINGQAGPANDFEMALQLPDKFVRKDVVGIMNDSTITNTRGFNGDGLVSAMDLPPGMMGGGGAGGPMVVTSAGGGGGATMMTFGGPGGGAARTPEAEAASRKATVITNKQDFARLALGLFANSFSAYPLTFATDSPAQSADGKFDILVVKGDGDFSAKLYLDHQSHLPAMLTWMGKEPVVRTMNANAGGGGVVMAGGGGGASADDMAAQMRQADANRKMVEYRMSYTEFKVVNGAKMPTRFARTIDGKPADDLVLEKITVNPKIDPKKFDIAK